ncbi:hypothetical protein ACEWY4_003179 [Coilia grayii]|uniref:Ig-like domain-containing protein n=1 Tax=Coilia grayii TaxID=363190 RepID=A0ABD1KRP0_9TELE
MRTNSFHFWDSQIEHCDDYFDYWGKGTQVTVSSVGSTAPTSLFPLSQCGSDSSGFVTLGCITSGFSPANFLKFKWKGPTGNELTDFIQYPDVEQNGKYSKVSQIRVQASEWEAKKAFTCELDYPNSDKRAVITQPEEILHIPSLYLTKPTSEEINNNRTATFACLAAEFSPPDHKFKWMKEVENEKREISGSYSFTSTGSGNHSATSYLQVPESTWIHPGTKITCVFEHKTGNHTRSVEYQMSDCEYDEADEVHVKIMPPTTEDMLVHKEGWVKCEITGSINLVKKASIEWRRNGKTAVWKEEEDLQKESDRIIIKLKVKFEEWQNGTEFSCFVPHDRVPAGITKSYKRENGGEHSKPSVFLMPPPEHEHSDKITLTCYAKNFYPKEVFVSWLADDEPVDDKEYSQDITSVIEHVGDSQKVTYSVYSQLTFSKEHWDDGVVFSCVVYHETTESTVRMIARSIDKASQKPNIVSLSMGTPQCRSG